MCTANEGSGWNFAAIYDQQTGIAAQTFQKVMLASRHYRPTFEIRASTDTIPNIAKRTDEVSDRDRLADGLVVAAAVRSTLQG